MPFDAVVRRLPLEEERGKVWWGGKERRHQNSGWKFSQTPFGISSGARVAVKQNTAHWHFRCHAKSYIKLQHCWLKTHLLCFNCVVHFPKHFFLLSSSIWWKYFSTWLSRSGSIAIYVSAYFCSEIQKPDHMWYSKHVCTHALTYK